MMSRDDIQLGADWHRLSEEEIAGRLRADPGRGLSPQEAVRRREKFGPNQIREGRRRALWQMLLDQFRDFTIMVLLVAAVISGLLGDAVDTLAILVIVLLNAIIGTVQEFRAERAIAALKAMAAPLARVVRNGQPGNIAGVELVPGDLVEIRAGDVVPADLRLLECADLEIDEAALTGESVGVAKTSAVLEQPEPHLGDKRNLAFKGTQVTRGRGRGIVFATGMATELGRIAGILQQTEESRTPLQKRLAAFGRRLALAILAICLLIFSVGLLRGEPWMLMFLTAVSLAVAAIPEALPAVVSVTLALGARKMSRRNALVRNLPAVETLGSVTYICSDKTGTLTQNKMSVDCVFADNELFDALPATDNPLWQRIKEALALSNDVTSHDGRLQGEPTELALYQAAESAGASRAELERQLPRSRELAFDADRKRMTTLHQQGDGVIAFCKGAPEAVLPLCEEVLTAAGDAAKQGPGLLEQAESLAARGYRVIALAMRRFEAPPAEVTPETIERRLTFLALLGLIDPPREEAAAAVQECVHAGIIPVMITGDHPATAQVIARRLHIQDEGGEIMTGSDLTRLPAEELEAKVKKVRVYARVSPEQKIRIVRALQNTGEFCVMTGDGVNDAPALKKADIGIAMGLKGVDVAREASDMVLLDDNFATIVSAVREGRHIFDNIRKFIKYTMTSNSGEIWTLFLAPFLGLPIPLLPIHILWINLVTDGLPGLTLAMEPEEKGLMQRPPRPPHENIFAHGMWQHIIWVGLLIGGLSLLAQAWAFYGGSAHWQTMVFTTLTLAQLVHVLAIRSEQESLFTIGLFSNLPLLGAVLGTVLLQLAVVYVPWFNAVFKTEPLGAVELGLCFLLAAAVFIAVEMEKWLVRRGLIYQGETTHPRAV
jgi:Ca2+-transporting ATPase